MEINEKPTSTTEERNKAAHDFRQMSAVIHQQGATFSFEPVGGTHISIMIETIMAKGILTHVIGNIRGPWGNWSDIRQGEQGRRPEWDAHLDVARLLAHEAKAWLHKLPGHEHWWTALIHDPPYGTIADLRRFHAAEKERDKPETENQPA